MNILSPFKVIVGKVAACSSAIVAISLLLMVFANIACLEENNMEGKNKKGHAAKPIPKVFLDHMYQDDIKAEILWTYIATVHPESSSRIESFSIESFEAKDQSDTDLPFGGASVGFMKGGVSIKLRTHIKSEKIEKVVVKAKVILNGDTIDVTCGYRKRTPEERKATNSDQEWTDLDELDEVKVTPGQ